MAINVKQQNGIILNMGSISNKDDSGVKNCVVNNFHSTVSNSQIQQQQYTQNSSQKMEINESDCAILKNTIEDILSNINQIKLTADKVEQIKLDMETMLLQLKSSSPKVSILKECWSSVRNITEGAAGSIVASDLIEKIQWISELLK